MSNLVEHATAAELTVAAIIDVVQDVFGVPANQLLSPRREQSIYRARVAVFGLALELTTKSLVQIARAVGNRDHTTAMSCRDRYQVLLQSPDEGEFQAMIEVARKTLEIIRRHHIHAEIWNIDAAGVARRVLANPVRGPLAASALEVRAMAQRILDLEDEVTFLTPITIPTETEHV